MRFWNLLIIIASVIEPVFNSCSSHGAVRAAYLGNLDYLKNCQHAIGSNGQLLVSAAKGGHLDITKFVCQLPNYDTFDEPYAYAWAEVYEQEHIAKWLWQEMSDENKIYAVKLQKLFEVDGK